MIEIEGPDGVIYEFPEGTSEDVMRTALMKVYGGSQPAQSPMQERIAAAKAGTLQMQPGSAESAAAADATALQGMGPGRTMAETLYENIVGSGDVDTIGERLGQLIRGGGAATARGMADVPALPANLLQLGALGVEKALGMEEPSMVSRALEALPDTRGLLASVPVIGPESEYKAPGTAGEFISTAGEFAGGAGLMAGPGSMVRYGVIPGLASEGAGQFTEGTSLEPYARMAAALLSPVAAGALGLGVQKVISPAAGQISPERQKAVDLLRREGVQPTAGQVVGGRAAENQLYREALTTSGRVKGDKAMEDFTSSVMARVGAPSGSRATPEVLTDAESRLSGVYKSVLGSTDLSPASGDLASMSSALRTYTEMAPKNSAPGLFENVNKQLVKSFRDGTPIPGEIAYSWRKKFSKLTKSQDDAIQSAAVEAVDAIDDMIENGLTSSGRAGDLDRFKAARGQFRNLFAIEKAAERADIDGIISPIALRTALLQQGRKRYVQGKGDLGPITRAAADILKPLPQSGTAPRLSAAQLLPGASAGTGVGLGAFGLGLEPITATAVGTAVAAAPIVRNQFLASGLGQRYFQNQLMNEFGPIVDRRMIGTLPGLLGN